MIQVIQPAAAIDTKTVRITGRTRPRRNFSNNVTAGVNRNVRTKANASGIRMSRAKNSAATTANTRTTAPALECAGLRRDTLIACPNRSRD